MEIIESQESDGWDSLDPDSKVKKMSFSKDYGNMNNKTLNISN